MKIKPVVWLFAFFFAGVLFTWGLVARTNRELRAALLLQTRLVAKAVDIGRVQSLSGTVADLGTPDYLRLKEQLASIRSANAQCRFIYLMGRKPDGAVFFYVDSEPIGSKNESPAGMIYRDVPEGFRRVFETGDACAEGPFTDQWGTFVSGAVPSCDPQTGAVIAVLGMDMDARDWSWNVATRVALPVGLMLVLFIGVTAAFVATRRAAPSPKPVLRRLWQPLVALVLLMAAGAAALLWHQNQSHLSMETASLASTVSGYLHAALDMQASGLAAALTPIANDPDVCHALREGHADRLSAGWQSAFETLRRENDIAYLCFSDARRVCLLNVGKPDGLGNQIGRFTALEAERTGKRSAGLELVPPGILYLSVVQPVFSGGTLAGYVELGKEITDVLQALHKGSGSQLAVTLRKDLLDRPSWEDAMRVRGGDSNWERLAHSVVAYASQGQLPDAFSPLAERAEAGDRSRHSQAGEAFVNGLNVRVSATPLKDASGAEVGDLLVMHDVTRATAAFARLTALSGAAGAVLVALLLAVSFTLLRRTDAGLRAQQSELLESEALQRVLLDSLPVGVVIVDPVTRLIERVNDHVVTLFGAPADCLVGRRCHSFLCPADEGKCPVCDLGKTVDNSERELLRADKSRMPIIKTVKRIQLKGQEKLLECFVDVSERTRAEAALAQTAERLSLATRAGGVGVWDFDLVNNRLLWDDQMFRLYGLTREQASDAFTSWRTGVLPEDLLREDAEVQMALRGEKEFDTEFRVAWPDGTIHNIRALAVVQRDDAHKPLRMIGTNWDITVLRTQTEELAATVQELQLFNQLSINRELFMIELKQQINDLRVRLGLPPAYDLQGLEDTTPNAGTQERSHTV
jgi:PAS domain-containing protein